MNKENPRIKELQGEINACKILLANTDYIALKIAEGVTKEGEYTEQLKNRETWRKKINECEAEISELSNEVAK